MPSTAAPSAAGHAFRSVPLATSASVPLRLRLRLLCRSPYPALFVYNLNVVFVCCRSLLPAKNSLSFSLSLSLSRSIPP